MPTIYSSVIKLTNLYPATLDYNGGQHAHGAFFHVIEQVAPVLSQQLHEIEGKGARKPFTVSPLFGLPQGSRRQALPASPVKLREGWQCWLRVTMLDDVLFRAFLEYFMSGGALPQIRLGDAHFLVSEILTTPGSHPWAGYITLDDLLKRMDEPAPRKLAFELHTPTQFGYKDDWKITLPLPRFVFGSLASSWRALTGEDNVHAVEEYAEKNLIFGRYDLRTENALIENKAHPGGVGKVEYLLTDKSDPILARALSLLADLAFYTGLGRKTTHGLGMTSRVG